MGRQINGLLYFFLMDIRRTFLIFWLIFLAVLALLFAIAHFLIGVENGSFDFAFPIAIYIYCLILGYQRVKESLPFSLRLGANRKTIFLAFGILFLIVSFITALVATTLQSAMEMWVDYAGIAFGFLHPAMLVEDTWLNRLIIESAILFTCQAFMFLMGLLFYRYGMVGGGVFCGLIGLALLLGIAQGWLFDFFVSLFGGVDLLFFIQLFGIGFLVFLLSYIFLWRITPAKG